MAYTQIHEKHSRFDIFAVQPAFRSLRLLLDSPAGPGQLALRGDFAEPRLVGPEQPRHRPHDGPAVPSIQQQLKERPSMQIGEQLSIGDYEEGCPECKKPAKLAKNHRTPHPKAGPASRKHSCICLLISRKLAPAVA